MIYATAAAAAIASAAITSRTFHCLSFFSHYPLAELSSPLRLFRHAIAAILSDIATVTVFSQRATPLFEPLRHYSFTPFYLY